MMRFSRKGKPNLHGRPLSERFWARVEIGPHGACWHWLGGRHQNQGYGRLNEGVPRGKTIYAHRVSWLLHFGEIPDGLCVLHRCDNPPCVNPAHLFLGTVTDNNADRHAKGRTKPGMPMRGELCGKATLTAADVTRMRDLASAGMKPVDLGRIFSIDASTVSKIVSRKRWAHV